MDTPGIRDLLASGWRHGLLALAAVLRLCAGLASRLEELLASLEASVGHADGITVTGGSHSQLDNCIDLGGDSDLLGVPDDTSPPEPADEEYWVQRCLQHEYDQAEERAIDQWGAIRDAQWDHEYAVTQRLMNPAAGWWDDSD